MAGRRLSYDTLFQLYIIYQQFGRQYFRYTEINGGLVAPSILAMMEEEGLVSCRDPNGRIMRVGGTRTKVWHVTHDGERRCLTFSPDLE